MKPHSCILSILLAIFLSACVDTGSSPELAGVQNNPTEISGNFADPERDPVYVSDNPGGTAFANKEEEFNALKECLDQEIQEVLVVEEGSDPLTCRLNYWEPAQASTSCEQAKKIYLAQTVTACDIAVTRFCQKFLSPDYPLQSLGRVDEVERCKYPDTLFPPGNPGLDCSVERRFLDRLNQECPQYDTTGIVVLRPEPEPDSNPSPGSLHCGPHPVIKIAIQDSPNKCYLGAWESDDAVECRLLRSVCSRSSHYDPEWILKLVKRMSEPIPVDAPGADEPAVPAVERDDVQPYPGNSHNLIP